MKKGQFYISLMSNKDKIMDLVNDPNWNNAQFKFLKLLAIRKHMNNNQNVDNEILERMLVL